MEKKIKIKSTSLTPLNETLQKLKLNDTVTDFTPVIVEADGKFTSIVNTREEFNPNDFGSSFETEEIENEEQKETKEQLLNKAKDALKQTLTNSKELNDILQKIQDLSKETGYNTWELNKEGNTASLKSKNATIFKQNNNLCLSHAGKIEIFHSVAELRDWLKEKGYPLPGNDIVIHESVEIKEEEEGRNWLDLLNDYNSKKKANPDEMYHFLDKDKYNKYNDEVNNFFKLQSKVSLATDKLLDKQKSIKQDLNILEIEERRLSNELASGIPLERAELENKLSNTTDSTQEERILFDLDKLKEKENKVLKRLNEIRTNITKTKDSSGNIIKTKEIGDLDFKNQELDNIHQELINLKNSEDYKKYDEILNNLKEIEKLSKFRELLNKHDAEQERYNKIHSNPEDIYSRSLGKPISKDILKADRNTKPIINPNRKYLQVDTDVDECCGGACVGTAALGSAVTYTASPKKKKEETNLQEAFESLIPGDTKLYPGKRELINKFLTWYKRNKPAVESGEIKLPDNIEEIFDTIIEPTYLNNSSDSVSRIWSKLITKRLTPLVSSFATAKKIDEETALTILMNNPNQKICDMLSKELNSYIPENEEFEYGKVQLIPGKPLLDIRHDNPNYQQRQNWQRAFYQAKNGGSIDKTETMVKTFNDFKNFIKKPKVTESTIFEAAKNYPWLNKILGTRLVEDDTPADFATGSPISSDMTTTDTTTTNTTTTNTTSDIPDVDMDNNTTPTNPNFGDINIDASGYSPDEGEPEIPAPVDMPEYKIIDILINDDNNDIKVKIENNDTKEIEIKNLEDIDV